MATNYLTLYNKASYAADGSTASTGAINMVSSTGAATWSNTLVAPNFSTLTGRTFSAYSATVNSTIGASTLTATGVVGIGTTAPTYGLLHIGNGTTTNLLRLGPSNQSGSSSTVLNGVTTQYGILFSSWQDTSTDKIGAKMVGINRAVYVNLPPYLVQATDLAFYVNNATGGAGNGTVDSTVEAMRIAAGGNVGIGTSTPFSHLTIVEGGNIYVGNSTASAFRFHHNSGNTSFLDYGSGDLSIRSSTGIGTETTRMTITSGGNVGISTTNPLSALDVRGSVYGGGIYSVVNGLTTGNGYVVLQSGSANNTGYIEFRRPGGVRDGFIGFGDTNVFYFNIEEARDLIIYTSGAERMRIKSSGNIGIGTTNPAWKLDVYGDIALSGYRLPRVYNAAFSGASSVSVPVYFSDTTYNFMEIRMTYSVSSVCDINLSARDGNAVALNLQECGLTSVKWNAQGTPVYDTFTNVTSGIFAKTVERVGIDHQVIFRLSRSGGTSTAGLRNHYSYDNTYCWSAVGTSRGYGQGHIDNTGVGGSPVAYVTFTCYVAGNISGTISGTYNTTHYY